MNELISLLTKLSNGRTEFASGQHWAASWTGLVQIVDEWKIADQNCECWEFDGDGKWQRRVYVFLLFIHVHIII